MINVSYINRSLAFSLHIVTVHPKQSPSPVILAPSATEAALLFVRFSPLPLSSRSSFISPPRANDSLSSRASSTSNSSSHRFNLRHCQQITTTLPCRCTNRGFPSPGSSKTLPSPSFRFEPFEVAVPSRNASRPNCIASLARPLRLPPLMVTRTISPPFITAPDLRGFPFRRLLLSFIVFIQILIVTTPIPDKIQFTVAISSIDKFIRSRD